MDIKEFAKTIRKNTMLVCGNGFSMNFDSGYSDIYDRLFTTLKEDMKYTTFSSSFINQNFNEKLKNNYKNCSKFIKKFNEYKLTKLFEDGIEFANYIMKDNELLEILNKRKIIGTLTFGFSELVILDSIVTMAKKRGYKYVNIENWVILIYFYYVLKSLKWKLPQNNLFIEAIKSGDKDSRVLIDKNESHYYYYHDTMFNGFYSFYRILMGTTIFNKGKAIDLVEHDKVNTLDVSSLKEFLNKFKIIATLNYDLIIEKLGINNVIHMHGQFHKNRDIQVMNQSLELVHNGSNFEMSDIIIGDYLTSKTMFKQTAKLASNNKYSPPIFDDLVVENKISNIVIFGMGIENDFHILRENILGLFKANVRNPKIIYCYFRDEEKTEFEKTYSSILTFSEEVNEFGKNIDVSFIKTVEILEEYFYKK